ncbi:MAG TPA: biotin/lipoyl-containing protein, partial [Acetobacteraceae bacterium]
MATNILMPALSPTMTEGTLSRWLKKEGEAVRSGDVIAEIETDKATMEVEAVDEGVLGKILVADGTEGVKVNAPIGVLVQPGETVSAAAPAQAAPAPAPAAKPAAPQTPAPQPQAQPRGNGHDAEARQFVSPLARRMALQGGIDLRGLTGSGPNGRIVKADIEAALHGRSAPAAPAAPAARAPTPAPTVTAPHRLVPNSSIRKVIARRIAEAKQTIPHFYVSMDIEIDALLKLRSDLNARSPKDGPG